MDQTNFDFLDYQIIQLLHKDGRISASEIARDTGANERTIRKRIDRLVELGAIRLTAIINPQAFDYITAADIFLESDPELEATAIETLMNMQEVSYLAYGQGNQDISIEARFKNNDDLREFIRHTLPSIPGIKLKGYTLVPRILKNIDEWQPKPVDFGITESDFRASNK